MRLLGKHGTSSQRVNGKDQREFSSEPPRLGMPSRTLFLSVSVSSKSAAAYKKPSFEADEIYE